MQIDGQRGMMMLTIAFCNFVNALRNEMCDFHGSEN
jgi:hypothetical protein